MSTDKNYTKGKKSKTLYAAFKAGDARFDGRFFVGVTSTGIYCRPTCSARMPKEENCVFFETAAEAEQAGFRPCLVCRPELAPGRAPIDAKTVLAERAARYLEQNCGSGKSLEKIAAELGYTDRHLRRVFTEAYNVTPVQYLQTCRLLFAKSLLTDTALSVAAVAMVAGFGSLRRFNDLFRQRYRLAPTDLRKQALGGRKKEIGIRVSLGYRRPYQWQMMLDFLTDRAIPGVESIEGDTYCRSVRLRDKKGKMAVGWVKVKNNDRKAVLEVTLSESLLSVMPQVLVKVKNLFDLYCDPDAVSRGLAGIDQTKPGAFVPGIRVPGCFDPFEISVRAVLGQQITVKAATTLAGRIAEAFGQPAASEGTEDFPKNLKYVFPSAEEILALGENIESALGPIGVIAARARTIRALAQLFVEEAKDTSPCGESEYSADPETKMEKLLEIKGIGPWTANYIAMRAFGWTDAFMEADHGIKTALKDMSPKEIKKSAEQWRPWRSYATMMLWNSEI